jgi:hypothetical protein
MDGKVPDVPAQWLVVEHDEGRATIVVVATNERHQLALRQSVTIDGIRVAFTEIPFRDLPIPAKIRAAQLGDAFIRNEAIRDPIKLVAMAAIKSPGVTEVEAAGYARNHAVPEDVIRHIATNRSWTKHKAVQANLCRNPKAPIAEVSRLLPFLSVKDLTSLSKSKGVPSAVTAQARKLIAQRGGRG